MAPKEQRSPKEKAARYCSLQERSQFQVRQKLKDYGVFGEEAEDIISELITLDFINEERFACAYVRGKFRMKKWGRNKILQGLHQHRISEYCIRKGFEEIDHEEYSQTGKEVLAKYRRTLKEKDPFRGRQKMLRFMVGKGYDISDVYEWLNEDQVG